MINLFFVIWFHKTSNLPFAIFLKSPPKDAAIAHSLNIVWVAFLWEIPQKQQLADKQKLEHHLLYLIFTLKNTLTCN